MDAKLGFIQSISIYATVVGAIIPTAIAVFRWAEERSRIARRAKDLAYVLQLRELLDPKSGVATVLGPTHGVEASLEFAKIEIQRVVRKLTEAKKPLSRLRRLLLLYIPANLRAWIAHAMFFSALAFPVAATVGEFMDGSLRGDAKYVIEFAPVCLCVILMVHAWASFEKRKFDGEVLAAWKAGALMYYPANNVFGLLAHLMFYLGVLSLIETFIPPAKLSEARGFPIWDVAVSYLVVAAFVPVAYCWASVEYSGRARFLGWLSWARLRGLLHRKWFAEQYIAICSVAAALLWAVWGLYGVVLVRGSTPVHDLEELGWVGKIVLVLALAVGFFFGRVLPFLAVYRGASVFFEADGKRRRAVAADGVLEEAENG
jgi:hypothetical protein